MQDYCVKRLYSDLEITCSDGKIIHYSKFILAQYKRFEELLSTSKNEITLPFNSLTVNTVLNKIQHHEFKDVDIYTIIDALEFCHEYSLTDTLECYDRLLSIKSVQLNDASLSNIVITAEKLNLPLTKKTIAIRCTSGRIASYKGLPYKICIIADSLQVTTKWLLDNDKENTPEYEIAFMSIVKIIVANKKLHSRKKPISHIKNNDEYFIT